jgi:hypothetical protein
MASGALMIKLQQLSNQLNQVTIAVSKLQLNRAGKTVLHTPTSDTTFATDLSLQQEILNLRQTIESMESNSVVTNDNSDNPEVTAERQYRQELSRQAVNDLVSNAVSRGQWSHADAEAFRNHAIELPPKVFEAMASEIIRGLENGSIAMPDDLIMPF